MNNTIEIHIGCSGFYNKHWKLVFYPKDMPTKNWLPFYATQLDSLELNSTFYKFPTEKILSNWYEKLPPMFMLSVKAPRIITHLHKMKDCESEINTFYDVCISSLKEKLACFLFQFPPSFHYSIENLNLITKQLRGNMPSVVEFRHPSWWNEKVYEAFRKNQLIFCNVSHPTMPQDIVFTSNTAYLRLHGSPIMFYSTYSDSYLKKLLEKFIYEKNLEKIFIFFNNTASEAGILNALKMKEIANQIKTSML